ncbi:Ku protein [Bosea sp. ANAM02]|uniref:non-homologous end joining protein Ku n=1 Tax=Bosea sp. ANAM02 TaxID=2020412 RepID=UPI00140EA67E|nr:non-homologous end joining protein Ku [Bosea sp. ANAM02]
MSGVRVVSVMAAYWRGYLKLSLVTCPVALSPATTDTEKVRFHTLARSTGQRVVSRYIDSVSLKPVNDEEDVVKGYEVEEGRFVIFEDEELAAVGLESARSIDIDMFAPKDSIGWSYLDSGYFLTPDDPVGEEAYAVIREGMVATDTVGISRVVLNRRERAVMLVPHGKGIMAWTLRFGNEVRRPGIYFGELGDAKPDPDLMKLADQLVAQKTEPWSEKLMEDPVQTHLLKIIDRKRGSIRKSAPGAKPATVINLFDALRESLKEEGAQRQRKH